LRAYGLGMTTEVLTVICAVGVVVPVLLAAARLRSRPVPVRVRSSDGQRPVNRSIER
jgi:hypothetical protein